MRERALLMLAIIGSFGLVAKNLPSYYYLRKTEEENEKMFFQNCFTHAFLISLLCKVFRNYRTIVLLLNNLLFRTKVLFLDFIDAWVWDKFAGSWNGIALLFGSRLWRILNEKSVRRKVEFNRNSFISENKFKTTVIALRYDFNKRG